MRTISAQWLRMNTRSSSVGRGTRASHLRLVLVAAFVLALPGPLQAPTFAAQAGRIDSIAPSCASVGDRMTITGIGFGASNVRITVDGVSVQVLTATGTKATFIVPAGVSLGTTTVTAMNPGGHVGSIAFRVCDLPLPAAWAGEWKMVLTYTDATTHSVTERDELTTVLCAEAPLGAGPFANLVGCTGTAGDDRLALSCTSAVTAGTCLANGSLQLTIERPATAPETLLGSGAWSAAVSGACATTLSSGESIAISGLRVSTAQPGCTQPPASLIRLFLSHFPVLVALLPAP